MDYDQREIYDSQDDCLLAIADGRRIDVIIRRLPPWRAVLIARVALKAGVMNQEEVDLLMEKAKMASKLNEEKTE